MAKLKGKGVVIAGLAAGAASFFSKKENRDKVMEYLNQAKTKVNENETVQNLMSKVQDVTNMNGKNSTTDSGGPTSSSGEFDNTFNSENKNENYAAEAKTHEEKIETFANQADTSNTTELEGNHFVEEGGALTLIDQYNEMQDDSTQEHDSQK